MTPGDSEITVERLQEIIELTLELEKVIPEEIGLAVQELVEGLVPALRYSPMLEPIPPQVSPTFSPVRLLTASLVHG